MTRVRSLLSAAATLAVLTLQATVAPAQAPMYYGGGIVETGVKADFGPVLSAVYGQGVHAFYAHRHDDAYRLLTDAINNGYQDPRAYYFRGLVADSQGRAYEAESDWQAGAELEAEGKINGDIGRALARIQGSCRARLEKIRREAKVQALLTKRSRSDARVNELGAPMTPRAATPQTVTPAPAPPTTLDDPFTDDMLGDAEVEKADALEDAAKAEVEPFGDEGAAGMDAATDDTGLDAGDGASPFDTGDEPDPFDAMEDSPFGTDDDSPF